LHRGHDQAQRERRERDRLAGGHAAEKMLADFLTMHEASHKPYDALTYAFVGDCRFNMAVPCW
jgi:hypothetical protein